MADVVVLAGGKGTRLAPYTTVFPKPLMPVGDMPVLEILLRRLAADGFTRVHLAVGHLAELIEAYFGDGRRFGIELLYWREDAPLGTAGPLATIETSAEQLLVMNGDLFTTLPFQDLLGHHEQTGVAATIAVLRREIPIEFGVVHVEDDRIAGFEEKPTISYDVSMGVYVFERSVVELIESGVPLDFPELLERLLDRGETVGAYRSDSFWLDIGRPEDYALAVSRFEELRAEFLGPT
jgi:NDP-mannose synthase